MKLMELLDTAVKFRVERATSDTFTADYVMSSTRTIRFEASWTGDSWMVHFYETHSGPDGTFDLFNMTGHGEELKVMTFVKLALAEFIKRYKPDTFTFSAAKDSRSRASLYARIIKRYVPDYDVEIDDDDFEDVLFLVSKRAD